MKNTLITLTATALLAMGSVAVADKTQGAITMTDAQMDQVVAGKPSWFDYSETLTYNYGEGEYDSSRVPTTESARPKETNLSHGSRNAYFDDSI